MIEREIWGSITEFNDNYFTDWKTRHPVFYTNAIAGEVGEMCGITKKMAGGGTHFNKTEPKLIEESVDSLIYLVLLLESQGYSPDDFRRAFWDKLAILHERMENNSSR